MVAPVPESDHERQGLFLVPIPSNDSNLFMLRAVYLSGPFAAGEEYRCKFTYDNNLGQTKEILLTGRAGCSHQLTFQIFGQIDFRDVNYSMDLELEVMDANLEPIVETVHTPTVELEKYNLSHAIDGRSWDEAFADMDAFAHHPIRASAITRDYPLLKYLLGKFNWDIDAPVTRTGQTLSHLAIDLQDVELANIILERRPSFVVRDCDGITVLDLIAKSPENPVSSIFSSLETQKK